MSIAPNITLFPIKFEEFHSYRYQLFAPNIATLSYQIRRFSKLQTRCEIFVLHLFLSLPNIKEGGIIFDFQSTGQVTNNSVILGHTESSFGLKMLMEKVISKIFQNYQIRWKIWSQINVQWAVTGQVTNKCVISITLQGTGSFWGTWETHLVKACYNLHRMNGWTNWRKR